MGIVKYSHTRFRYTMRKITREEVWLRAFEAVVKATTARSGYDGDISSGQVARCHDRADETLEAFEYRFRDEDEDE